MLGYTLATITVFCILDFAHLWYNCKQNTMVTRAFREFIIPLKKAPLLPLSLSLPLPLPCLAQFYFLFIRKIKEFCLVLSLLAMN